MKINNKTDKGLLGCSPMCDHEPMFLQRGEPTNRLKWLSGTVFCMTWFVAVPRNLLASSTYSGVVMSSEAPARKHVGQLMVRGSSLRPKRRTRAREAVFLEKLSTHLQVSTAREIELGVHAPAKIINREHDHVICVGLPIGRA